MHEILIIGDAEARRGNVGQRLAGMAGVDFKDLEVIENEIPLGQYTLVDVDLDDNSLLLALKERFGRAPDGAKVVFAIDKGARLQQMRAQAIGATEVINRPVDAPKLLTKFWGDVSSLAADPSQPGEQHPPGVAAGIDSLQKVFSSACLGAPIDSPAIQAAGDAVVGEIEEQGLTAWVDTVRRHHSQTYQHCLIVTGLAVAFGQKIGASQADRQRLSVAGMLHDIGKARIPVSILEKPGPLDTDEMDVVKKHPEYGVDALASAPSMAPEMIDMVLHHHEYLDGSGYPHGLSGGEISDLVRVMTISDIFGALIERRAYKPPLSGEAAYKILQDMGRKLDQDLVREFKFASRLC